MLTAVTNPSADTVAMSGLSDVQVTGWFGTRFPLASRTVPVSWSVSPITTSGASTLKTTAGPESLPLGLVALWPHAAHPTLNAHSSSDQASQRRNVVP
jgi:hypothetical protein